MNLNLNETYCWYSIGLHPRWNIFVFPFLPDKRLNWWVHLNVGRNAYSFDLSCSNNFSKWIKFGYEVNMCTWLCIYSWLYMSVLWWCRTQIPAEQKILKRYCQSSRITNVNWLFIAVLMHYVTRFSLICKFLDRIENCPI